VTGTLRWNHIFSPKLFANTMLIGSSYKLTSGFFSEDRYDADITSNSLKLHSGIQDYGVKTDLDFRPTPTHTIKMGASYMYRIFTPGAVRMRQTSGTSVTLDSMNNNHNISASENDLYIEDDWEISRKLKLNGGLHWSSFIVQGQFYSSLQPRLGLRYLLPGDWGLKASYTRMTQYIHLLAYNSISLPTDLWVPATKKVAPQQAEQFAVGVARNLFKNRFEFSIEGYYKKMRHVIEYKEGADYLTSSEGDSWQEQVASGTGDSYGVELLLQKKTGRLTGWLGYTWATANRKMETVNFGRTFPYKYDRRHDLHLVAVYKVKRNVELSGSWTYQSAMPFTIQIAQYERTDGPVQPNNNSSGYQNLPQNIDYINSRNNVRIGTYHRLDAGISWIKQKKNGNVRTWNISVLNVYNKLNPFFYYAENFSKNSANALFTGVAIL
ncbi:MAG TPA: TonB-dependent receptor, partial [Niastella sp.]|nr:TonB-dependent receptor [Niastella sp.]